MLKRKRINPTRARRMFNAVFISVAFLFSLMAVLTGNYVDVAFNLQPGQLSPRRIQSPRDTVNLPATLAKRAAAEAEVRAATAVNPPIIRDETVTAYALGVLQAFFEEVEVLRQRHNPIFDPVLGEMPEAVPIAYMDGADLRVPTPDEAQLAFLVASPSYVYVEFREYVLSIVTERLMAVGGIVEEHLPGVRDSVIAEINLLDNWAEEAKQVAHSLIIATLTANMVIDYENIETQIANAISAVESIIILRGQDIVLEGAFITDEIYEVLVSLGLVQGRLAELVGTVFGAIITVAAVFIIGIMYIVTAYRKLMMDRKNVVLLFTLFMLTILGAYMLPAVSFVFVPIILFTMLASILLDKSLAIAFCIWVSIICAGITIGDIRFVIYFMLTGIFSAIMSRMIIERSKMLSVTVLVSAFSFLAVLAVFLLSERAPSREMWDTAAFAAIVGLVSIVFAVGVLPLFETAFGFVTAIKLVELANPNHPLLRRLIIEAPGTYQHSLVVASLAETAAFSIGANHALARVGGYYHDVGKLNYPSYFIENQSGGINPHDDMDPHLSAKIIGEHVSNGISLANQYKLPKQLRAFIEEHHGGSVHKFFYNKAREQAGLEGVSVNEDDFRYKFRTPHSREVAVVMLADITEAAVRSMVQTGKVTMDELPSFITQLIKAALMDGRLQESGLVIKELSVIAEAFMRVFKGMFHERIAYPTSALKLEPVPETYNTEPGEEMKKDVIIHMNNETEHDITQYYKAIERAAETTMRSEDSIGEISLTFVTAAEIKELNKNYRNNDKVTDVLSFSSGQTPDGGVLGDVFICHDKAVAQSEEIGNSVERELCFLAVHGILHILGYDHEDEESERIMKIKQKEILP